MDFWKTTEKDVVLAEKTGNVKHTESNIGCMRMLFGLLDSEIFPHIADKTSLYMLLYKYIIKYSNNSDRANIYHNYYKKGKLASCVPANILAERSGKSERTIYRQIKDLEKLGVIKINKIRSTNSWDKQQHSVYILGTHDSTGNETYFINNTISKQND